MRSVSTKTLDGKGGLKLNKNSPHYNPWRHPTTYCTPTTESSRKCLSYSEDKKTSELESSDNEMDEQILTDDEEEVMSSTKYDLSSINDGSSGSKETTHNGNDAPKECERKLTITFSEISDLGTKLISFPDL